MADNVTDQKTISITVQSLPNLKFTSVSYPTTAAEGSTVRINYAVRNDGGAGTGFVKIVGQPFRQEFSISASGTYSNYFEFVMPNYNINWTIQTGYVS